LSNASGDSNLKFAKQCGLTSTTNKRTGYMPVFIPSGKDFRTSGSWLANGAIANLYYTLKLAQNSRRCKMLKPATLDVKNNH
jgi:hypothetical protein